MPVWNDGKKRYDEEDCDELDATAKPAAEREERFRTALLNELDALTRTVSAVGDQLEGRH